jgi:hypothetical protein
MPKAPTSRSPYRLLLPSPIGLPPQSSFYFRSSPSTPTPPSRHALRGGLLHEYARALSPAVKHEMEETVPQTPQRLVPQS